MLTMPFPSRLLDDLLENNEFQQLTISITQRTYVRFRLERMDRSYSADDLHSEFTIKLLNVKDRCLPADIQDDAELTGWLTLIAINTAIDRFRQFKRRKALLTGDSEAEATKLKECRFGPEFRCERQQLLRDLSDEERLTLLLKWQGFNFYEIGRLLGFSHTTAISRFEQGMAKIRRQASPQVLRAAGA